MGGEEISARSFAGCCCRTGGKIVSLFRTNQNQQDMKRILLLLAALWFVMPSFATMQFPEQLIVGRDTMHLFVQPLDMADRATQARLKERMNEVDTLFYSACWRGYIGYWRLEEGQLWLERLVTCEGKPLITAEELFPGQAEQGRVRASWFSGEICYGRGKVVLVWDRNFSRRSGPPPSRQAVSETSAPSETGGASAAQIHRRMSAGFPRPSTGLAPRIRCLRKCFSP